MGMDLFGVGGSYSANGSAWRAILDLARSYGWKPLGTIAVCFEEWSGSIRDELELARLTKEYGRHDYYSNDGFIVSKTDAESLAVALQRALDHVDQPLTKSQVDFSIDTRDELEEARKRYDAQSHKASKATTNEEGDRIPAIMIKDLVTFCRAGAFRIG